MSTGEGADPRSGAANRDERGRDQQIGLSGGDDSVSRIQLAARWAEAYRTDGDSLVSVLKRFRVAYEYLDAVIHGVDPPELEQPPTPAPAPAPAPYEQPRWSEPTPSHAEGGSPPPWSRPTEPGAPPPTPPAPPTEPRPWG